MDSGKLTISGLIVPRVGSSPRVPLRSVGVRQLLSFPLRSVGVGQLLSFSLRSVGVRQLLSFRYHISAAYLPDDEGGSRSFCYHIDATCLPDDEGGIDWGYLGWLVIDAYGYSILGLHLEA